MNNYFRFLFCGKKIKNIDPTFELLWVMWLVTTAIYLAIVLNLGNNIYFEKWNAYYLIAFVYVIPRFNDGAHFYKCFGKDGYKKKYVLIVYNIIIILIEIMVSFTIAKSNQLNLSAYWLGQLAFVLLWIGSLPLIYIKNVKRWIVYEVVLLFFITVLIKVVVL